MSVLLKVTHPRKIISVHFGSFFYHFIILCFLYCQQRLQKGQVFGGKSSVRGSVSGMASSVAFTPLQGLEIVNPMAAEKKVPEVMCQ